MNANDENNLETSLKDLTWWTGPTPRLWKKALTTRRHPKPAGPGRLVRILQSRWCWAATPIAAIIVAAVTVNMLEWSAPESKKGAAQSWAYALKTVTTNGSRNEVIPWSDGNCDGSDDILWGAPGLADGSYTPSLGEAFRTEVAAGNYTYYASTETDKTTATGAPGRGGSTTDVAYAGVRHVVRKAAVDLKTDDVRGLYLKVLKIIPNEAVGEYVEQSQIYDQQEQPSAYVTLRVRSERLSEALNTLRGLGEVIREESNAGDVTGQVVDLEARLRNERRVEKELLELLDKRQDAPLQDVLKVSESLSAVRERIEKMTAQQQQIQHQVALATIVVSIRSTEKPVTPPPVESQLTQLQNKMSAAVKDGGAYLVGSVAFLVRMLIGGLLWWVILCLALWLLRRWVLRLSSRTT